MKNLKILFLEDNDLFVDAINEIFEQQGWLVTHVTSVKLAKELFNTGEFDLVISDLHLKDLETGAPNSGLDLVHHIRHRKRSKIPIVVTTGLELVSKDTLLDNDINLFYYKSNFDVKNFISNIHDLFKN